MEQNLQQVTKRIQDLVDSAFNKGLVSSILAWFPVTSIIAIFLAAASKNASSEAVELGNVSGNEVGGKNIAAKILNTVGLVSGIVMSVIWGIYFLIIIAAILAI